MYQASIGLWIVVFFAMAALSCGSPKVNTPPKAPQKSTGTELADKEETAEEKDEEPEIVNVADQIGESEWETADPSQTSPGIYSGPMPIGVIRDESSSLPVFKGISVYAEHITSSHQLEENQTQNLYELVLKVTDKVVTRSDMREVSSYVCSPCRGTADPNCRLYQPNEAEYSHIDVSFSTSFSGSVNDNIDELAFPVAGAYEAGDRGFSLKHCQADRVTSKESCENAAGTVQFELLPRTYGDEFVATIQLAHSNGTYQSTVRGRVFQSRESIPKPECANGEYPRPVYRDDYQD